jgi:hypothetical protein
MQLPCLWVPKQVNSGTCESKTPVHGFMQSYDGASLPAQDVWNISCTGGWSAGNFVGPVSEVAKYTYDLYVNCKSLAMVWRLVFTLFCR